METKVIDVMDVIGKSVAVTTTDAKKLHDLLVSNINQGIKSDLDFGRITTLITAFLNESIGTLYSVATEDELNTLITVNKKTTTPRQYNRIIDVLNNAKRKHNETREVEK